VDELMDQQDDGLSLDQVLGNTTSPSGSTTPTAQPDMLAYANQQLASGMHPEDAMQAATEKYGPSQGFKFELSPDGKSFKDQGTPAELSLDQVLSEPPKDTGKGLTVDQITNNKGPSDTPHSNVMSRLSDTLKGFNDLTDAMMSHKQEDISQFAGNIRTYFHNYTQEHELTDGGQITPQQRAAAKLLGTDLGDFPVWGPVYKMSPEDKQKLDTQYQKSLGLTPEETQARLEKTTSADTKDLKEFDPIGKFLNDSAMSHFIGQAGSPEQATTKRYHEVNEMVQNMDAVEHPDKYSPEFVKYSANKILAYKKMNETGVTQQLKDFAGDIKKNPLGQGKALAGGLLSEPELAIAPEAKLGSALLGGREAAASAAVQSAAKLRTLAESVRGAAEAVPDVGEAASRASNLYTKLGDNALARQRILAAARHVGDIVGKSGTGAAINVGTAAAEQENQQGFVQKGSLEVPAITGAGFGAASHIFDHGQLREDLIDRAQPKPQTGPDHTSVEDVNAGRKPGQPLSPDTPVNKDATVPYYGGVDASGKVIHLDENTPDSVQMTNRQGKKVPVNVQQTVGYHEAVEFPLMHMEGPIDDDTLAELQQRIGPNHTLPPKTIQKLKEGKSLVYTNPDHEDTDPGGHEIATWAENHMVDTLYDIDPNHYQDSLKPYIKKVGKESQKPGAASNIPDNLDTKPYDDVDESEQLEGQGNRPAVDNVEPGVEQNKDNKQKGKVDPRLLATGAVVGGGAIAGSMMPGDKEKNALVGSIAGLATSALFWGGDVGASGERLKQGGMFVGPKSRVWKEAGPKMAEAMEKIGKSPDEITLATGLHRNKAGQWTKEISDKDMSFVPTDHPNWERAEKEPIPLSTVMNHDKLDAAYPGLSDEVKIKIDPSLGPKKLGSFDIKNNTIILRDVPKPGDTSKTSARSVIAHELQHAIQEIEGFPTGSNVQFQKEKLSVVRQYLEKRNEDIYQQIQKAQNDGTYKDKLKDLERKYDQVQDQLIGNYARSSMDESAKLDYVRQAGEVQARNTQNRLNMTEEERATKTPRTTEDVRRDAQIIKFPNKQRGSVDPETLGKLARAAVLGTVGATVGLRLGSDDDKWKSALMGAGLAVMSGPLLTQFFMHPVESVKRVVGNMKQTINAPVKENINDAVSRWQENGLQAEVSVYRTQKAIERLVPTKASRIKITHALDSGNTAGLNPKEQAAYKVARQFDDDLGKLGIQHGVLDQLINNHISHIWKNDEKLQAYKQLINSQVIANMSPNTAFNTARQLKSIAQGKAMGLTPVTEDVSEILGIYAKSVLSAIRNKQLLETMKATKDSAGQSFLVMPSRKAPYNYVPINHPQLRGLSVHPTIAPELRNVFYSFDLGPVQTVLGTLNMALKRSQVSFSAFHLTSLMDAYSGGMPTLTHPIETVKGAVKSVMGTSDYHKALLGKADPGTQQLFDRFLASGARPQIPRGSGADVDMNNNYYEGLRHIQDYADKAMPGLGKVTEGVAKLSHMMDHIIFANGMSAMKFSLWMHAVGEMNKAWADELHSNPNAKIPKQEDIDKIAGGYVNNLLGAQNWLQAAQQASTRLGKTYLNALGSPAGRKISQYMLYAPDWTTSTAMSFTKALGRGSGIKGLFKPKTTADLHRIYQFRSALLYAMIGGAINYAYSGHYLWQNKDPFTIDLGNGQRLQWNKHWTEPYDIMRRPAQSAINKMGIFPREALEQILGKEYINTSGYSPPMKDRMAHLAGNAVPIPFENLGEQTPQQLMWNLAGRNVEGHPTSGPEGEKYKKEQHERRSEAAKKAAETRKEKRLKDLYGS
jgi:hypothetical protein